MPNVFFYPIDKYDKLFDPVDTLTSMKCVSKFSVLEKFFLHKPLVQVFFQLFAGRLNIRTDGLKFSGVRSPRRSSKALAKGARTANEARLPVKRYSSYRQPVTRSWNGQAGRHGDETGCAVRHVEMTPALQYRCMKRPRT